MDDHFHLNPTESLQLSGLRIALYNYLFASAHKGRLIVRIENAGLAECSPQNEQSIFDGLRWAGIVPAESSAHGGDCGPYETGQRLDIYRAHADRLLANQSAYYCFCSKEQLDEQEKTSMKTTNMPKYDNRCRQLTGEQVAQKLAEQAPKRIR